MLHVQCNVASMQNIKPNTREQAHIPKITLFLSVRSNVVIALRGQLVGNPYFMDRRESYSNSTTALRSTYVNKRTSSDSTRSELQSS